MTTTADRYNALALDWAAAPDHWDEQDWIDWGRDAAAALREAASREAVIERVRAKVIEAADAWDIERGDDRGSFGRLLSHLDDALGTDQPVRPAPRVPTREEIAKMLFFLDAENLSPRVWDRVKDMPDAEWARKCWRMADAVLALLRDDQEGVTP
jgi:hypothetical protein